MLKLILLTFLQILWEASPKRENENFISEYFNREKTSHTVCMHV